MQDQLKADLYMHRLFFPGLREGRSPIGSNEKLSVDSQRPEWGLMVYWTKDEFGRLAEHLKRCGVEYWFHPKGKLG